jgi:hypothetical protein
VARNPKDWETDMSERTTSAEAWLDRIKRKPVIAWTIVVFAIVTALLGAPLEMVEKIKKSSRISRPAHSSRPTNDQLSLLGIT